MSEIINNLKLKIITPESILFDGVVKSVTLPTQSGVITVLRNHAPIITLLSIGEIHFENEDKSIEKFEVQGGVVDIRADNGGVYILADEKISESENKTDKELEESILRAKDAMLVKKEDEDFSILEGEMERSLYLLRRNKNKK